MDFSETSIKIKGFELRLENFYINRNHIHVGGRVLKILHKEIIVRPLHQEKEFTAQFMDKILYFITDNEEKELLRVVISQFN